MTTYGNSINVGSAIEVVLIAFSDPEYTLGLVACDGCEEVFVRESDTGEHYHVNTYGDVWEVEDRETEFMWSDFYEKDFCLGCVESDHGSTIVRFEAPDGDKEVVHFNDCEVRDAEFGEVPQWFIETGFKERSYVSTDGWRGYYDTKFEHLTEIDSGWVTGDWSDVPWKRDMHSFYEALQEKAITPPVDLFIVFEPTSNVFSTATGLWARNGEADTLKEWLDSEVEYDVHRALG